MFLFFFFRRCRIGPGERAVSNYSSIQRTLSIVATVTLEIEGMTCASCVSAVEGAGAQCAGITSIAVNLIMGDAVVTYDSTTVSVEQIITAIEDAGFEAKKKDASSSNGTTVIFDIEGMTCSSCSEVLERRLLEKKGVIAVSVNLIENVCSIEHDSALIGVRDLMALIEDIGIS